jgi:hypothetical protein
VYAYLSKESPEFPGTNTNMISVFVLNFDFPKILVKTWGHAWFWEKGKNTKEFLVQWFCKYKGVLSMLFA